MKKLIGVLVTVGLFMLSGTALAQDKGMMQGKHAEMMEMMKDSTMMKQMMENIASNDQTRNMMMHKMMESVKGDSTKMMEMCKMMMGNHDMHGMMMKMMGKDGMMKDGMMKHDMMGKKSTDDKSKNADKEADHKSHH